MLSSDVIEAVKAGMFHIYAVSHIDEGIEILTGKKAGVRQKNGHFPKGTIHYLVDERLRELAKPLLQRTGDKAKPAKAPEACEKDKEGRIASASGLWTGG